MRRVLVLVVVLIGILVPVRTASAQELQQAVLELFVNEAPRGEVFVWLRDGDVLVPLESLRDAGLTRLDVPVEPLEGKPHVSLRGAKPLRFVFDEAALALRVTAPPQVLPRSVIDLSAEPPSDMRYDHATSAFLNYAPRLIDGERFQTFAEAGVSFGTLVADTSATYDSERGATRLLTRAVYDDPIHLRSATLGDAFVAAGPLGGAVMLGGLSVSRNFSLDPYLVKIPRLGFTGKALSPSTVDVYVNDVLMRRVPVDAGEFQLTNIVPATGSGSTRYVLRDAYGGEQRLESTYYASSVVLAAGLSEYSYGVGLVRRGLGSESWSYGEPALIGRHRFGATDQLTPGYHLEWDRTRVNAGPELTIATAFGEIEVHAAASTSIQGAEHRGAAGLIGYSFRNRGTSLRTVMRAATGRYSTLSLEPEADRSLIEHVTTTSHALGPNASVATEVALAWMRDVGPSGRLALTANARLSNDISLQLRTSRSQSTLGRWEHDMFATLTWALPAGQSAAITEHLGPNGSDLTGRLSRPLRRPTDVGYQLSGSTGEVNHATATVQGQSSIGRVAATYTNVEGRQSTMLEAAGSIVFAEGRPHLTRPSTQSFAVLHVPGAAGVRGYLNNVEVGRTDAEGRLFVPDLLPYQANRLRIEQSDLPIDYELDDEELVLAPPTRGGAVVVFPARPVRIVRGQIVRASAAGPVPVAYGELSVAMAGRTLSSPLGAAGEFELDGLEVGVWEGSVRSTAGSCSVRIEVPRSGAFLRDVGAVSCVGP